MFRRRRPPAGGRLRHSHADHVQGGLGAAGVIVASALADLVERSNDLIGDARTYLTELKLAASGAAAR